MKPNTIQKRIPKEVRVHVTEGKTNPFTFFQGVNYTPIITRTKWSGRKNELKTGITWDVETGRTVFTEVFSSSPLKVFSFDFDGGYDVFWIPEGLDVFTDPDEGREKVFGVQKDPSSDQQESPKKDDPPSMVQPPRQLEIFQTDPVSVDLEDDFWQQVTPVYNGFAPAEVLWRTDKYSERYYFRRPEGKPPKGYLSVTSFVKKALPTSQALINFYKNNSNPDEIRDERAEYGTVLHIVAVQTVTEGGGSFEEIRETFRGAAMATNGADPERWANDGVRDVFAFIVFVLEREVEILAAEYPVYSDKYGLAGCIDFVVRMKFGRDKVNALLDIKSGRKGFWESHEAQLHAYKVIWNEDPIRREVFPVIHVFNWRPTEWRDKPKYELKNQTESIFADTIEYRMGLAKMEGWVDPPTTRQIIRGDFSLQTFDPNNHIFNLPIFGE